MTNNLQPKYFVSQSIRLPIYTFDIVDSVDPILVKDICLGTLEQYPNNRPDLVKEGWQSKPFARNELGLDTLCKVVEEKTSVTAGNVYKIESYWFVIYYNNGSQKWHDHGDSDLSAVYYPEVGNNPSKIIFKNQEQEDLKISVNKNKLLIFPSKLVHCVEPNANNELRISVAFNLRMVKFNPLYLYS
jgi:hypothetical protein